MNESSGTGQGLASVVICAWNNWPDLEMTIESALNQSYTPLEVIVVDNSSTDATPGEVPARYANRLQYVRQENRDTAGAYNAGFALARGEFLQFLDGDDVLAPNKIEKQVEVLRRDPGIDLVYGDIGIFQTGPGTPAWTVVPCREERDVLMAALAGPVGICTDVGMLYRRRALEKTGPWDETLYVNDLDYLLRAAWAGCRFGYCPGGPMGFARVRPDSKTRNRSAMDRGNEAVWTKAQGYVDREPDRSLVADKLARLRLFMAMSSDGMTTGERLAKLAQARAASASAVPTFVYSLAWITLVVPGARSAAQADWLRPIRRVLLRLAR